MAGEVDDLEDLFDHAPCGYLAAGADGRITKVNSTFCKWLGRDKSTFIGHRFQDFLNIAGKIYYETHFAPLMRMQGFFNEVALDLVRARRIDHFLSSSMPQSGATNRAICDSSALPSSMPPIAAAMSESFSKRAAPQSGPTPNCSNSTTHSNVASPRRSRGD